MQPCRPSSLGGYAAERTRAYSNASARAVVLLVETSDAKASRRRTAQSLAIVVAVSVVGVVVAVSVVGRCRLVGLCTRSYGSP